MRQFLKTAIVAVLAFALGGLGTLKLVQTKPELVSADTPIGHLINTTVGKPENVDYGLYWDVYGKLESKYPKEIDRQELLYGAIKGTVAALGDRFSLFLSPEEARRFFEDINGEFSGIGAEISQEGEYFVIVAPLPGSPAERAGLKAQDVITSVDGKEATEFQFGELINAIRGPKDSQVTLGILRDGFDQPKEFTVTRDTITVDSVMYTLRDDGLAYVKINQFSESTVQEFSDAVDQLRADGATGVIIDLRNNPGGFLDSAIDITSFFVDEGPVVSELRKGDDRQAFDTTHEPTLKGFPLAVLVNGGSASASEIFTGAIQDRKAGTVIGTQTFGKGSVQEVEQFSDGSALRLTIAKWLTPNDREINGTGLTPDVVLEDDESTPADEQLNRAVEVLTHQ